MKTQSVSNRAWGFKLVQGHGWTAGSLGFGFCLNSGSGFYSR